MPAALPPAAAGAFDGTALAGAALYVVLFGLGLWGIWRLAAGGPAGPPPGSGGSDSP